MSIDYQLYLAPLPYTTVLTSINLIKHTDREHVVSGEIGESGLLAYIIKKPSAKRFSRDELKSCPTCQLILTPDLENYDHSMSAMIETINQLIPATHTSALYMNNELLLLEKLNDQTTLYTSDNDWWSEHINNITFSHIQR